jgi:hypothetical protein
MQLERQLHRLGATLDRCDGERDRRPPELHGDATVADTGRPSGPMPGDLTDSATACPTAAASTGFAALQRHSVGLALPPTAEQRVGVRSLLLHAQRGADEDGLLHAQELGQASLHLDGLLRRQASAALARAAATCPTTGSSADSTPPGCWGQPWFVTNSSNQSINHIYDSVTSFVAKYTVLWCCARHPHAAEIY